MLERTTQPQTLIEKLENFRDTQTYYEATFADAVIDSCIDIVEQHSDWVSMDERLPENNVFVLVWLKSGYSEVLQRSEYEHPNEPSTFIWGKLCCNGYFTDWDITAWQPIQPPSEVQDD